MIRFLKHALIAALAAHGASAAAADYPDRPVRLLVGYAAGGGTDRLARLFAKALGEATNVPVDEETNRWGEAVRLTGFHP